MYEKAGVEPAGPAVRPAGPLRAALYCRLSTTGQTAENQLVALRSFAVARGWDPVRSMVIVMIRPPVSRLADDGHEPHRAVVLPGPE